MRVIWKYNIDLRVQEVARIPMPTGSEILHVACQQPNVLSFWAEAEIEDEERFDWQEREFQVFGTGHEIVAPSGTGRERERLVYVGTALDGLYVWHLYEWR